MAKITPENIAGLKALFQDNEKALGSNFSQLIDFFNNNKVTDNGDDTFTVGAITVDASKLYDLINNSSPNILPLDNEFTGKNTFDIAPINKANGKPYITADSVPQVDLSNYTTKDQLATKADTSAIDPSVLAKKTLTADDDVLTLTDGIYKVWGPVPKNLPNIGYGNGSDWGYIMVKSIDTARLVTYSNTVGNSEINILRGDPVNWSGWQVPNSTTMATKSDVTTAISAATANMVDPSKPTNFTAGLQSGGVDVATAADLKSVEDSAWRELDLSGTSGQYTGKIKIKIDGANKTIYLDGAMYFSDGIRMHQGDTIIDLSNVVNSITSVNGYVFFIKGTNQNAAEIGYDNELSASTLKFIGTKINLDLQPIFRGAANYILPFPNPGKPNIYVTYDKLV